MDGHRHCDSARCQPIGARLFAAVMAAMSSHLCGACTMGVVLHMKQCLCTDKHEFLLCT
jgi:hypothetical protein